MSEMESKQLIVEEGKKRFRQIMEYMNLGNSLVDEDDNDKDAPDAGGPQDAGGGPMGGDPMGGGAPAGGGDPMGGQDPMGGGAPMGAQDPMGGQAPAGPQDSGAPQPPQGFDPQDQSAMGGDPMGGGMADGSMGGEQPGPDDDVVDITDLTDSQEETEEKIDGINDRFDKVLKAIGKFEEMIDSSNKRIDALKAEYEKRNPTQIEKLSLQTSKGYPFNVSPEDYWKEKEATTNYSADFDNNGKEQGQYTITAKDVNGDVDWKSISDSLDDNDFIFNQTLKGAMGI